jgi:hypothetical protein
VTLHFTTGRVNDVDVIVVDLGASFSAQSPDSIDLETLGRETHVQVENVLQCILLLPANQLAVRALSNSPGRMRAPHADASETTPQTAGAYDPGEYPGDIELAGRVLREDAYHTAPIARDPRYFTTTALFATWRIPYRVAGRAVRVTLPRAPQLAPVAHDARGRSVTLSTTAPDLAPFTAYLDRIASTTADVVRMNGGIDALVHDAAPIYGLVESMSAILVSLGAHPGSAAPPRTDARWTQLDNAQRAVKALARVAAAELVASPSLVRQRRSDPHATSIPRRNELADQLWHLLSDQTDAGLNHLLDTLVFPDPSLVPTTTLMRFYDVLRNAYTALAQTPSGDQVSTHDLEPLFQWTDASPPSESLLYAVVRGLASTGASTFGNTAGPSTLVVAAVRVYAWVITTRVTGTTTQSGTFQGMLRLIQRLGALNTTETNALNQAVTNASRDGLASAFDVNNHFMCSSSWGGVMGILNLVLLFVAIQETQTPQDAFQRWTNIFNITAPASSVALDAALVFQHQSRWVSTFANGTMNSVDAETWRTMSIAQRAGSLGEQGLGGAGRVVGSIGAIVALESSIEQIWGASQSGHSFDLGIGIANLASAGMSIAGYLLTFGAATSWAAGAGEVLMTLGAIVGVTATAYAIYHAVTTPGSQQVFQALVDQFHDDYRVVAARGSNADFATKLTAVQTVAEAGFWWEPTGERDNVEFLRGAHFNAAAIDAITGSDAGTRLVPEIQSDEADARDRASETDQHRHRDAMIEHNRVEEQRRQQWEQAHPAQAQSR